jgi:zinc transport system substrate-binding protein
VTSIAPLHLIAADIMQGVSEPELLMGKGSDPHHYSMRLSERRALARADIVLWIGPELELPLADLVEQLDGSIITSSELPGITLIDHDPHLWLDAGNALTIAEAFTRELVRQDAENSARYSANLDHFRETLAQSDSEIAGRLEKTQTPLAVYHNAFGYFEKRYGLAHRVSLTENEALKPGIQQLLALRDLVEDNAAVCLLSEPGADTRELGSLAGKATLRLMAVDPLGQNSAFESDRFVSFLNATAAAIQQCLEGESHE